MPVSRWFAHYAAVFDTVEVNNTFYRLPEAETFDQWREQAPPGFLYAVKASRFLTHRKKLADPEEPLERLLSRARRLHSALGPILFQLPPRWKPNAERLRHFLQLLPRDLRFAVEFRDPSWLTDEIYSLLSEHRVALCVHDRLEHPCRTVGPFLYVRFHGGSQSGGGYTDDELQRWADWVRAAAQHQPTAYLYFNNDLEGHAIRNALRFRDLLNQQG